MEELYFFRCQTCQKPVSQWDIHELGKCPTCGGHKVSPTNLTFIEKVQQILKHPKIWKWKDEIKSI